MRLLLPRLTRLSGGFAAGCALGFVLGGKDTALLLTEIALMVFVILSWFQMMLWVLTVWAPQRREGGR